MILKRCPYHKDSTISKTIFSTYVFNNCNCEYYRYANSYFLIKEIEIIIFMNSNIIEFEHNKKIFAKLEGDQMTIEMIEKVIENLEFI